MTVTSHSSTVTELPHIIYEVWQHDKEGSFKKFTELATATYYIRQLLKDARVDVHIHVHIVTHSSAEYS
jgi:hypothetical protein